MQDRPDGPELLEAVAAYLFGELRKQAPRQERFKILVAANVCAVVAREIRAGAEPARRDAALFGRILGREVAESAEEAEPTARAAAGELAAMLRAGELDDRLDEILPMLSEHVRRKLAIARPGYDEPGPGRRSGPEGG